MTTSTAPVSVLLVDDQPRFRDAARSMLTTVPAGFDVVGEAATGEEGVRLAAVLRPRLVVMDVMLPGIDGPEASRRIKARYPDTVVVLASARKQADLGLSLEGTGAAAFIQKEKLTPAALRALL
jgi:two-component system, NarL family, invasion response regulator UvrY